MCRLLSDASEDNAGQASLSLPLKKKSLKKALHLFCWRLGLLFLSLFGGFCIVVFFVFLL